MLNLHSQLACSESGRDCPDMQKSLTLLGFQLDSYLKMYELFGSRVRSLNYQLRAIRNTSCFEHQGLAVRIFFRESIRPRPTVTLFWLVLLSIIWIGISTLKFRWLEPLKAYPQSFYCWQTIVKICLNLQKTHNTAIGYFKNF